METLLAWCLYIEGSELEYKAFLLSCLLLFPVKSLLLSNGSLLSLSSLI